MRHSLPCWYQEYGKCFVNKINNILNIFLLQITPEKLEYFVTCFRANPKRFNFDNIGDALLTLFEVLSFKGWLDVRDVLIKALGPVSKYFYLFIKLCITSQIFGQILLYV